MTPYMKVLAESEKRKKRIIAMANKGILDREIAEKIGVSRQYVHAVRKSWAVGLGCHTGRRE